MGSSLLKKQKTGYENGQINNGMANIIYIGFETLPKFIASMRTTEVEKGDIN